MKKTNSLRQNHLFNKVLMSGHKKHTNFFLLSKIPTNEETKLKIGISVPKKFGNSVFRNKIKRQIKSIITPIINDFNFQNLNVVILIKKPLIDLNFDQKKILIQKQMKDFLK